MEGQWNEYQYALAHKNVKSNESKCGNMETYSQEVEIGRKKVRVTLEFPYTVDSKDVDRFEHMLKEVYLNNIQKGFLQAVSFQPLKGGMNHE